MGLSKLRVVAAVAVTVGVCGGMTAGGRGAEATGKDMPAAASQVAPKPTMMFKFENASVDTVLGEMSARLGFVIVKTDNIPGSITIMVPTPVDADQAIALLNSFLVPNHFAAIERPQIDGTSNRRLEVMTWEKAKKMAPVGK